jgi:hypothetical protein
MSILLASVGVSLAIGLEPVWAGIIIAPVGSISRDHRGTVNPADDQFSVNIHISTVAPEKIEGGWTSQTIPGGGSYLDANPVAFGPFPVGGGSQVVKLIDASDPAFASNVLIIDPPVPSITATLVVGSVVRQENAPGNSDDTIHFQVMVSGSNGGPSFGLASYPAVATTPVAAITAIPTLVTVTLTPAPSHGATVVSFQDASYPLVTAHVLIEIPPPSQAEAFVVGRKNLGNGWVDLLNDPTDTDPAWINYPGLRVMEMTNGGGGDTKIFMSEEISLSGIQEVRFTGTLRAISRKGGFEIEDGFYASLVINRRSTYPIRLVGRYDRGSPGNGMMNGGSDPTLDEFNAAGTTAGPYESVFSLDATIPKWVHTVQLFVRGVNDSADETLIVEDVLFEIPSDADGDGIPDHYEESGGLDKNASEDRDLDLDGDGQSNFQEYIAGTAANDARSVLRITEIRKEGTFVTVTWNSVPEKLYLIEAGPDLSFWFQASGDLPAAPYHATSTTTTLSMAPLGIIPPQYFLRVRLK